MSNDDEKILILDSQESSILRDVCYARMKVLKAGAPNRGQELPWYHQLNAFAVRQCIEVFDFFQSANDGNEEAVGYHAFVQKSRGPHAGGGYYDGLIADYQRLIPGLMRESKYTIEDINNLHDRIKEFVKTLKT